jgi:hypothetical protein
MREVSRTSTGIWYESRLGGFFQLPYPPAPRGWAKLSMAEQIEWGLRFMRERYGVAGGVPPASGDQVPRKPI